MRDEDVDAIRRGYESWNRGEPDFALLHPDVEWSPGEESPDAGVFQGRDGFTAFVASWSESFDDFRLEPEEIIVEGDHAIVVVHQSGRGRGSGIELDIRTVHVWTIRDGMAMGWAAYRTTEGARAALADRP